MDLHAAGHAAPEVPPGGEASAQALGLGVERGGPAGVPEVSLQRDPLGLRAPHQAHRASERPVHGRRQRPAGVAADRDREVPQRRVRGDRPWCCQPHVVRQVHDAGGRADDARDGALRVDRDAVAAVPGGFEPRRHAQHAGCRGAALEGAGHAAVADPVDPQPEAAQLHEVQALEPEVRAGDLAGLRLHGAVPPAAQERAGGLRVDAEPVSQALERPVQVHDTPQAGHQAGALQVAQVHAAVEPHVGLELSHAAEGSRRPDAGRQDRRLQAVELQVEQGRDPHASLGGAQGNRVLPGPPAPRRRHVEMAEPHRAGEADPLDREHPLAEDLVGQATLRHREAADHQRLAQGLVRLVGRRRPHLQGGGHHLDGTEVEGVAPQERRGQDDASAGHGQAVGRALDDEVLDLGAQASRHHAHAPHAAPGPQSLLEAALDVAAEQLLREEADRDQAEEHQGRERTGQEGPAPPGHGRVRGRSFLTFIDRDMPSRYILSEGPPR